MARIPPLPFFLEGGGGQFSLSQLGWWYDYEVFSLFWGDNFVSLDKLVSYLAQFQVQSSFMAGIDLASFWHDKLNV